MVMSHSAHLCSRLRPCLSGYRVETARSRGSVVEADASYGTQRQTKAPGPPRPATSTAQNESLDVVRFCSAEPRRAPAARSRPPPGSGERREATHPVAGRRSEPQARGGSGSRALEGPCERGFPRPACSPPSWIPAFHPLRPPRSPATSVFWRRRVCGGGPEIVTENKQNRKARLQTRTFGVGLLPATHEGTGAHEAPRLQGRGGRSTPPAGLGRGREDAGAPAPPGPSLS